MTRCLLTVPLLAALAAVPASAENWPQWRGPKNDGHSPEKGIPAEFGPDKNLVWKFPMASFGSSTPCVWGDRIFLTAQEGTDAFLICVGTDGKERWRKQMGSGPPSGKADEGANLATPSPSTDGKLVFAFVGSGKLAAFDLDGNEVWGIDVTQRYGPISGRPVIQFGPHWTPVLHKDRLYVCLMHRQAQLVIALEKATGKEVWKIDRKSDSPRGVESPDVYASPVIWEKGDQAMLIVHGNDYCTGHKLENGEEVWRVTELNPKANYNRAWRAVSSPLATPDLIIVPTCKQHPTVAIDPLQATGVIGPGHPAERWRFRRTPDVPSPLMVDGVVYLVDAQVGSLYAVDAKTGEQLYEEPRLTNSRVRSSPVYADGKIIILGRDGLVPVVKPGRQFEVLAKNKLPDTFTASPVVSGGRLYLRGWNHLWAFGTK
jgi:outer membrane protein assembly factor BamB